MAVTREDQDRFTKQVLPAVTARHNGVAPERFWQHFQGEFLATIHQWCRQHRDRVAACYVPFPRDHLQVFFVSSASKYDFSLSDDLSALEMDLYEKNWPSDINQIPLGSQSTFFDPTASIQVYGDTG